MEESIFRTYTLDYLGKYNFYEEEKLIEEKEDGQYIIDMLRESNRFDYNGATYTFTKYNNISEGVTEKNVNIEIESNNINVKINGDLVHLDLIYKMDVKRLEDHYRITTRISEKGDSVSALLYINLNDADDFINALKEVRRYQTQFMNGVIDNNL